MNFKFYGEEVTMRLGLYANNRVAVEFVCADGEPFGKLTVNLPHEPLEPNETFVKTWAENEVFREPILACGLFEDTGKRVPTGFVEAEVWRFKGDKV